MLVTQDQTYFNEILHDISIKLNLGTVLFLKL